MKRITSICAGIILLLASCTTLPATDEPYRPAYHFTPASGWMNDPNGMVYVDGEYHLFYQYNPADIVWGPMHWGHAVSTDLMHWTHLPVALYPDSLGTIFSGSAVIDKENTAGFGANALVAIFTSAGKSQTQSIAYSTDRGRTFTKYAGNPVLTDSVPDFRDPKVFWYEPLKRWTMILAVGQEMRIYSSPDLKAWTYRSSFGAGQGAHGGVWECPDLFELPGEGTDETRWVLLCNLNPGGPFGGSGTQYFTGTFDGNSFTNEAPGEVTKWMDWGKDNYATVTWSNAPRQRRIALGWMSNWQYADKVPTQHFRSANTVPRDLSLYRRADGGIYLQSAPSSELFALRGKAKKQAAITVDRTYNVGELLADTDGVYELEMTLTDLTAEVAGFALFNDGGDRVDCYYNQMERALYFDRTKSGPTAFSPDFPAVTSAPVEQGDTLSLRLLVDRASIELFINGGREVMTNLVFPAVPYNRISFYAKGGTFNVSSTLYPYKP
ncbi:MAG: glycoside hydrolase family 32 protein [Prevotellaceae bacterium]|jgi:fructan beta-fructosidase|nr:glycoside hydrolase family 32 protein [Prevotellaceae bacterium]